jgi:hypothetical protein
MKFTLLFCAGVCFSLFSHAQTVHVRPASKDTLKVSLEKETLSVTYKNQVVPVHNLAALDSFMKKVPDAQRLEILFESLNAKAETSRSINAVLQKCNCHITGISRSFRD